MSHRRGETPSADSIEEQVRAVIASTFDLDEDDLPTPLGPETIPQWSSRSQMTLLLNLEERFEVRFSLDQVVSMTSVELISAVVGALLRT